MFLFDTEVYRGIFTVITIFSRTDRVTSPKQGTKTFLAKYFEQRLNTRIKFYSIIVLLIHIGFLWHALTIIFTQYLKYEIVTSTGRIKTNNTKSLPRITICPYYQMEENIWYHYKKVVYGVDNLSKKWNLPRNWGIMRGLENKESSQSLYLNLDKDCLTNECQCDFNPNNNLPQSDLEI